MGNAYTLREMEVAHTLGEMIGWPVPWEPWLWLSPGLCCKHRRRHADMQLWPGACCSWAICADPLKHPIFPTLA